MDMELVRRLGNLVSVGTVCEIQEGYALARVKVLDRVTAFLPVMMVANSFKRHFTPIRVGEQVVVIAPYGETNGGFIVRSIFNKSCKEPNGANSTTEVIEFEDGVRVTYDTSSSMLEISSPISINITCTNANIKATSVKVDASDVSVNATTTTVTSPSISLVGNTSIQGTISTAGSGGSGGEFSIKGNLNIDGNISTSGNASFGGSVSDSRGSLTNHTNNGYSRD